MTCTELLQNGTLDTWYYVSAKSGVFQVKFTSIPEEETNDDLPFFSIAKMHETEIKVMVLEDMFEYAAAHGEDHAYFRNNRHIMLATIDILETI